MYSIIRHTRTKSFLFRRFFRPRVWSSCSESLAKLDRSMGGTSGWRTASLWDTLTSSLKSTAGLSYVWLAICESRWLGPFRLRLDWVRCLVRLWRAGADVLWRSPLRATCELSPSFWVEQFVATSPATPWPLDDLTKCTGISVASSSLSELMALLLAVCLRSRGTWLTGRGGKLVSKTLSSTRWPCERLLGLPKIKPQAT